MEGGGQRDLVKLGTESSSLQWPGDLQTGAQTAKDDRTSVRSDVSVTESERELLIRRGGGATGKTAGGSHLEKEEEEPVENQLPAEAAQVFTPAVTVLHPSPSSPREIQEFWEMESQRSPLLVPQGMPHNYNHHEYQFGYDQATPPSTRTCTDVCLWRAGQGAEEGGVLTFVCPPVSGGHGCASRDVLKVGVSLMSAAMFFPFLAWGGYVFLPFDAPLLDGAPLRLVYTLRCSVFAVTPIILGEYKPTTTISSSHLCVTPVASPVCGSGWLVLGASRLKYGVIRPLFDDVVKEAGTREVSIHRCFLSDSSSLFLIYFLQLVILAMYLSQEQLKLVPLLAIIFAFGR